MSLTANQKGQALQELYNSIGWKIIQEWIDEQVVYKESIIFGVNAEDNDRMYTKKDTFILERKQLLELKEAPNSILRWIELTIEWPTLEDALKDVNNMPNVI